MSPYHPHRRHRLLLLALTLAVFLGAPSRHAEAHLPPPAYAVVKIGDDAVRFRIVVNFDVFPDWFGFEAETLPDDPAAVPEGLRRKIEEAFARSLTVTIDRVEVKGTYESVTKDVYNDHGVEWRYVNAIVRFETKGPPRQVSLAWTRYDGGGGWVFDAVEAELEAYGETDYFAFRETEPEFTWHEPLERPPPPAFVAPAPRKPPSVRLPLLATGLFLLVILAFAVTTMRGAPRRDRWVSAGIGLALVMAFSDVAKVEVALPWGGGFERPSEEEALYAFEALLRNTYRAFDYESESDIYDTLAKSVTGDLLESVYAEVQSSLVMQEEGGAVCKIQRVDVPERELMPAEDPHAPFFVVRARWQVEGKVGHWGHTHQRVNEYEALFRVVQEPEGWKIATMEVLDLVRTDDGKRR